MMSMVTLNQIILKVILIPSFLEGCYCKLMPEIICNILAVAFITVVQANNWPDPKKDPLVYIANPIEANVPSHWVPASIVKAILLGKTPANDNNTKPTARRMKSKLPWKS